MMSKVYILEY